MFLGYCILPLCKYSLQAFPRRGTGLFIPVWILRSDSICIHLNDKWCPEVCCNHFKLAWPWAQTWLPMASCASANSNFYWAVPQGIIVFQFFTHFHWSTNQLALFTWLAWGREMWWEESPPAFSSFTVGTCLLPGWLAVYLARVLFTTGVCSAFLYCFRIPGRIRMVGSMSFNFEFGAEHVMNQCLEGLEEGVQQWWAFHGEHTLFFTPVAKLLHWVAYKLHLIVCLAMWLIFLHGSYL